MLAVLALVARFDGANGLLFHMEQCGNGAWQYRVRWPESSIPSLQQWQRIRETNGSHAIFQMLDPHAAVEAQWRWVPEKEEDGAEPVWELAVPHEFAPTFASFRVRVKRPRSFVKDPVIRALAMVKGWPASFDLTLPRCEVSEPAEFEVRGDCLHLGPGACLCEPGEFSCGDEAFDIVNLGPSHQPLVAIEGPALPGQLTYVGSFFVKTGRLTPEEIQLLLASDHA